MTDGSNNWGGRVRTVMVTVAWVSALLLAYMAIELDGKPLTPANDTGIPNSPVHSASTGAEVGPAPTPTEFVMSRDAQVPLRGVEPRYARSGPGRVRCGNQTCSTRISAPEVCCEGERGSACQDAKQPCPKFSWTLSCDETADCGPGERCCFEQRVAACVARPCRYDRDQLCSGDDECESGKCTGGAQCASASAGRIKLPGKP
jgi:hypothetical protein